MVFWDSLGKMEAGSAGKLSAKRIIRSPPRRCRAVFDSPMDFFAIEHPSHGSENPGGVGAEPPHRRRPGETIRREFRRGAKMKLFTIGYGGAMPQPNSTSPRLACNRVSEARTFETRLRCESGTALGVLSEPEVNRRSAVTSG